MLRDELPFSTGVTTLAVILLLSSGVIGLAVEADKPSYLQLATVRLRDGEERRGYFVSEDADNAYLGGHETIVSYPHDTLRSVTVHPAAKAKRFHGPKPLAFRLVELVWSI
jgi:hypothetical protein